MIHFVFFSIHLILLYTTCLFAKPPFNLLVMKIFHPSHPSETWLLLVHFSSAFIMMALRGEGNMLLVRLTEEGGSMNMKNCTCWIISYTNLSDIFVCKFASLISVSLLPSEISPSNSNFAFLANRH